MNKNKGKFIVLYGINNLGKTTQAKLLVEKINLTNKKAIYLKYPIYNISPSGTMINDYLRNNNPHNLTVREVQLLYAMNRFQYENELKNILESGTHVIAEDYTGTGLCWGIGAGADEKFMRKINATLLQEDIAFLFEGKRFLEATETNHKHETNNELMQKVHDVHQRLGQEFGWLKTNANLSIEEIHNQLWKIISPQL
jgi:thymidylate kinase